MACRNPAQADANFTAAGASTSGPIRIARDSRCQCLGAGEGNGHPLTLAVPGPSRGVNRAFQIGSAASGQRQRLGDRPRLAQVWRQTEANIRDGPVVRGKHAGRIR